MVITSVVYPQEKKFVVDIPAGRHICTVDGRHTSRHKSIKNVTNVFPPPLTKFTETMALLTGTTCRHQPTLYKHKLIEWCPKVSCFKGAGSSPRSCNVYCALMLRPMPYFFWQIMPEVPFETHTQRKTAQGVEKIYPSYHFAVKYVDLFQVFIEGERNGRMLQPFRKKKAGNWYFAETPGAKPTHIKSLQCFQLLRPSQTIQSLWTGNYKCWQNYIHENDSLASN